MQRVILVLSLVVCLSQVQARNPLEAWEALGDNVMLASLRHPAEQREPAAAPLGLGLLQTNLGTKPTPTQEKTEKKIQTKRLKHPGEKRATSGTPMVSISSDGETPIISPKVPIALGAGLAILILGSIISGGKSAVFAVAGFMACSSMMLVVNKLAITFLPFPGTLLALQLLACGLGVWIAGLCKIVEVEPLCVDKVVKFGVTPLAFLCTLVANIKILEYANVETFIMVRNATPLMTSMLDYIFLGRALPDVKSVGALLVALVGASGYVAMDATFELRAYTWAVIWLAIFLFDQVYIKHVISTVPMTPWTRVYYTNIIAGFPALVYAIAIENVQDILVTGWVGGMVTGILVVAVSCAMGTAMSYFSFCARDAVSATSFTVVGNVCKVLSVLVNVLLWDKHASPLGLIGLCVCMLGSAMYVQAPMREEAGEKMALNK